MFKFFGSRLEWYNIGCYHDRIKPTTYGFLCDLIFELKGYLKWLWCEHKGHQWKDVSVAGPETGNVHIVCTRCEAECETILY